MSRNQSADRLMDDPLKKTPAYYLKSGSSISVRGWNEETCEIVRPNSGLISRPASHPQLVPDLSVPVLEETMYRRTLHEYLCKEEPWAFKKLFLPESPSEFYLQRHLVRDYLLDLHKFHAPNDVATPKFPITKSLKEKPPPVELRTIVEDFLQPKNLTRKRVTGYSPGHIRSLLDLDTFGPNHSQTVEAKRRSGILPMSPNVSRFSPTATRRLSGISESGSRMGTPSAFKPAVSFAAEFSPIKPSAMLSQKLGPFEDDDDESDATPAMKSIAKSINISLSAQEIAEMDNDIRKSNPTYKRIEYAKSCKAKADRKVEKKIEKSTKKKMAARLRAEINEYQASLEDFESNVLKGYNTRV